MPDTRQMTTIEQAQIVVDFIKNVGTCTDCDSCRATALDILPLAKKLQAAYNEDKARLDDLRNIVDLYFQPWGAAKAAMWEEMSDDGPFTAETALRLIQKAAARKQAEVPDDAIR